MRRAILLGLVLYCLVNLARAEVAVLEVTEPSRAQGIERSAAVKRQFAKEHPCPVTGKPVPHCIGYVLDHRMPLCAGGPDEPDNLQWQAIDAAKSKDHIEKAYCACLRKHGRDACAWWP